MEIYEPQKRLRTSSSKALQVEGSHKSHHQNNYLERKWTTPEKSRTGILHPRPKYRFIVFISKIHFTEKAALKIIGCRAYSINHPSNVAQSGTAVIIEECLQQHEMEKNTPQRFRVKKIPITDQQQKHVSCSTLLY